MTPLVFQSQRRSPLEWGLLAVYLLMIGLGVAFHEPWRDEWRAWMIGATAASPVQLWDLLSGEGHPWLWYALLKPFTLWPGGSAGLALVGLGTGLVGSLLLFLCFRLPLWIRAGVLFSAYWLVEYVVVSRSYGLAYALTSLGLLAVLRGRRWLSGALLIGLAAHTHLLIALANLPLIALLALWGRRLPGRRRLLALVLVLLLSATGIASAVGSRALAYGQSRLASITAKAAQVVPGLPRVPPVPGRLPQAAGSERQLDEPSTDVRAPKDASDDGAIAGSANPRRLIPLLAPGLILLVLAGLWRRSRLVVLVYGLPAFTILMLFLRLIYRGGPWHQGTVFMVLVYSLVLAAEDPTASQPNRLAIWLDGPWLASLRHSRPGARMAMLALSLLLLLGAADGLHQWFEDLGQPFSGAPAAAAFIGDRGLTSRQILPRSSDMDEALTIALQPEARVARPIGSLLPLHRLKWNLSETRICRLAAERAQQLQQPVVIVANARHGGPTRCPGLTTRSRRFDGLRESLEIVEIQP